MRLLFVGDFRTRQSSGYAVILRNVCTALADQGYAITVLGLRWERGEHDLPFQVLPSDFSWVPMQVLRVHQALQFDHCILAMDVPRIVDVLHEVEKQKLAGWPDVSGLFPIESRPLLEDWAQALGQLRHRFVISEFGQEVLAESGLDSVFLPMTAKAPALNVPRADALARLKERVAYGNPDLLDERLKILLTVADNQERKDVPVICEAIAYLRERHDLRVTWMLVTSIESPHGWRLPELLNAFGVAEQTVMFQMLEDDELSMAYSAADVLVLASQAEGACLPLYEAMAHDLHCVAPDHTAITEALADERGNLVPPSWKTTHPWGNVERFHVRPADLGEAVVTSLGSNGSGPGLREFIESRPWSESAERLEATLCQS